MPKIPPSSSPLPRIYPGGFAKAIVKSLPAMRWEKRPFDLKVSNLMWGQ